MKLKLLFATVFVGGSIWAACSCFVSSSCQTGGPGNLQWDCGSGNSGTYSCCSDTTYYAFGGCNSSRDPIFSCTYQHRSSGEWIYYGGWCPNGCGRG